jgi:hypothetical protein
MEKRVANVRYTEDPTTAQTIPSIKSEGSSSRSFVGMTLVWVISVTRAPTVIPRISAAVAVTIAFLRVRERDATEVVAKEFAALSSPFRRR